MKKFTWLVFLLVLCTGNVFSQTIPGSAFLNPSETSNIEKEIAQINPDSTFTSYKSGEYAVGKEITDTLTHIYRTYFKFNLSTIPDNATVTQVEVNYWMSGFNYTFKLTKLSSLSGSLQARWNAIGNGSSLHTGLTYGNASFVSTPIKTEIQNALGTNELIVGALSDNESTDGSYSTLGLYLYVDYTTPAQALDIWVRNDLYGDDGGNVGVAIYPDSPVSHSSPYKVSPKPLETNRLNLAAYDNQTVNSKVWFFNNTEYAYERSEWRVVKDPQNIKVSDSQSFTTSPLAVGDNGATFKAFLKTTTYTTSGALSSSETWWTPVTLSGNVTVPSGKTLTITSNGSINLNGYYIKSTGGMITNNGTVNPSNIRVEQSSTLKGFYPSISSALNNASSGQTVHVYSGTFSNSSLTVPSGVTLKFDPNVTCQFSSGAGLYINGTLKADAASNIVRSSMPTMASMATTPVPKSRITPSATTTTPSISTIRNPR